MVRYWFVGSVLCLVTGGEKRERKRQEAIFEEVDAGYKEAPRSGGRMRKFVGGGVHFACRPSICVLDIHLCLSIHTKRRLVRDSGVWLGWIFHVLARVRIPCVDDDWLLACVVLVRDGEPPARCG